jgi:SAM-dependent methyltransferase
MRCSTASRRDTLSWARRGAKVTGVDFSSESIRVARQLAEELGLDSQFAESDIYELQHALNGRFDVVFTSYGVLVWLPDLTRWAEAIAHFLAEDGVFYLVEEHPVGAMLTEENGKLVAARPYFDAGPVECPGEGTYADPAAQLTSGPCYEWQHPLSDVINALLGAGMRIVFLHEFPFSDWQRLPSMVRRGCGDGFWRLPARDDLPFLFSLLPRKP